jgi:hypothetical protein
MILYVCIDIDQSHCNSSFRLYWCILLNMVSQTETCEGWKVKKERGKENIYQSHWMELIPFYNIASVTDQDEPNQIQVIFVRTINYKLLLKCLILIIQ